MVLLLDNVTGLLWAQDMKTPGPTDGFNALNCTRSGLQVNWQEALDHVKCINTYSYLGFTDLRLPTAGELASIVNYSVADQHAGLASAGFIIPIGMQSASGHYYWSSTTRLDSNTHAFALGRNNGNVESFPKGYFSYSRNAYAANWNCANGYNCDYYLAWPVRGNQ